MCSGSEVGSNSRLIDFGISQLYRLESHTEEEDCGGRRGAHKRQDIGLGFMIKAFALTPQPFLHLAFFIIPDLPEVFAYRGTSLTPPRTLQ